MHHLLDSEQPLPQNFAVAPYYEMALDAAHPLRERVLAELLLLDTLFRSKERPGNKPFHDWMSEADFQDFADQWFAASMGLSLIHI